MGKLTLSDLDDIIIMLTYTINQVEKGINNEG